MSGKVDSPTEERVASAGKGDREVCEGSWREQLRQTGIGELDAFPLLIGSALRALDGDREGQSGQGHAQAVRQQLLFGFSQFTEFDALGTEEQGCQRLELNLDLKKRAVDRG
ncbi:MAG: hypothetical protein ACMVO3_00595 [Thalassobaculum sp.]